MYDNERPLQPAQTQDLRIDVRDCCPVLGRDNWIGELDFSANQAPGTQSGWLSMLADAVPCSTFPGVWG